METSTFEIQADDGCNITHVNRPTSPDAEGDVHLRQDSDVIVWSRKQAIEAHAWLGEYIEETKPKLPTAGESVVRARVPNGDTISLIFNAVSRSWWANTGADYASSELRDWTLIFDAGRPL